jgi:hypothetical protein
MGREWNFSPGVPVSIPATWRRSAMLLFWEAMFKTIPDPASYTIKPYNWLEYRV